MKKRVFMLIVTMFTMISGILVVNAATPDKNPPVLKSISIKNPKKSYNVGDKVYLNIDANDDVSGLNEMNIIMCAPGDGDTIEESIYNCDPIGYFEVFDLLSNPYIVLDDDVFAGSYVFEQIYIWDNNGNDAFYSPYTNVYDDAKKVNEVVLNVEGNSSTDKRDNEAPYLDDINFDKTNLKYGDKLKITASAHDNDSGVDRIEVIFYTNYNNRDISFSEELFYDYKTKLYVGYLSTPYLDGKYVLSALNIFDNAGNSRFYETNPTPGSMDQGEPLKKFSFTVSGASKKLASVGIEKIIYKYVKLVAPSTYEISLKLNDKSKLVNSGVIEIKLDGSGSNPPIQTELKLDDNGYLTGYIDINQYYKPGKYSISRISLYNDKKDLTSDLNKSINDNLTYDKLALFEVVEDNRYDVVTSTTDKEMLKKIKEAKQNAKIVINSLNDSIIKKEVFESIQNTNKTIYIESNGIQWVFNGNSIKNPKEIDAKVSINKIYDNELNDNIGNFIDKGIVIDFMDNGELPGLALIKVKTDYALRDYLGTEGMQVYYYNGSGTQMFDEVANDISMTDDGNFEFYITHNSSFVISNKKVDKKLISNNKKDLEVNGGNLDQTDSKTIDNANAKKDDNKLFTYIAYAVISVSVVGLIISIIVLKKRKKNNVETGKGLIDDVSEQKKDVKKEKSDKKEAVEK